jgi:hypothetical protein
MDSISVSTRRRPTILDYPSGIFCLGVFLVLAGCAELGEAWRKAGDDVGALFETSPPGPTKDEQRRGQAVYQRALDARAKGDPEAAANHLRAAAELGNARAAYALGIAYIDGDGVPEDLALSAYWINRAADLGDPGAQFLVGSSLYAGIGVEQDTARGLAFLEQAADQGHPKAQFLLGQAYVDGVGVKKNAEWAARWYGKSAYGGDPGAQYALGVMFATGLGVPRSPRRAYEWFSIAAANGYENAAKLRDSVAGRLSPSALAAADAKVARFSPNESVGYSDASTVMFVQMRLHTLGYDAGPIDGIAGPKTRAAIEAFQTSERTMVDGRLSPSLVESLLAR